MRVAILEDDPSQIELMSHWLQRAGHHVRGFQRGTELLAALAAESFDALMLDWNLPDVAGIDILKQLRAWPESGIPVLFMSGRDTEEDVVMALRAGADDYLVKPVRRLELLARLDAVTRRSRRKQAGPDTLQVGTFTVNVHARTILRDEMPLEVTAKDFDLSVLFLSNVGRLLLRDYICHRVWGQNAGMKSRTLDTHVCRVRSKLALTPDCGWQLAAVYGYGYRLDSLHAASRHDAQ